MISGWIDEELMLPFVNIEIQGADGEYHCVPAVLDTGCNRPLLVPKYLMKKLGIPQQGETSYNSATHEGEVVPAYHVNLKWREEEHEDIEAAQTNRLPILGMPLCEGMKIRVDMRRGGGVWLEDVITHEKGLETP